MLDIAPHPRSRNADCPRCGYKQAFSVTLKDGRPLYYCHAGCDPRDLWGTVRGQRPEYVAQRPKPKDYTRVRHYAQQLWDGALPPQGTLVERYLASRSLCVLPDCLRFLPCHLHKNSGQYWPVMLAAVTDTQGKLQAVHRTYLAEDGNGKAPVEPAKMTLGAVGGFAVHFAPAAEEMAVAEGIETALSVQLVTGIPTVAAVNAGNMKQLVLPRLPLAREVIIAADADPVGRKSAQDAALRWDREGRRVRIAAPPNGLDFNDLLQAGGAL